MIITTALSDLLFPFARHLLLAHNWEMNRKEFRVSPVTSNTFKGSSFEKDPSGANIQHVPSSSVRRKGSSKSQTQNGTSKRLRKFLFLRQSPSSSSSSVSTRDLTPVKIEGKDMTVREEYSVLLRCLHKSPGFAPLTVTMTPENLPNPFGAVEYGSARERSAEEEEMDGTEEIQMTREGFEENTITSDCQDSSQRGNKPIMPFKVLYNNWVSPDF